MSPALALTAVWLLLLSAILVGPFWLAVPSPGDALIRNTIRLALPFYAAALSLLMWSKAAPLVRLARCCWTLGWVSYLVHLAMAFHFAHDWSHADAMRHTEEVAGVGAGIFVSHFFTLVWTADVASWWLAPHWHATRPVWIDRLMHGFMLFVVFNGTVVFEQGVARWGGVVLFAWLIGLALYGRLRRSADAKPQAASYSPRS